MSFVIIHKEWSHPFVGVPPTKIRFHQTFPKHRLCSVHQEWQRAVEQRVHSFPSSISSFLTSGLFSSPLPRIFLFIILNHHEKDRFYRLCRNALCDNADKRSKL